MLNKKDLERIKDKVSEIRKQYNISEPGVDLNELIDNFNKNNKDIQIIASEIDLSELSKQYKIPVSGFSRKHENTIYISVERKENAMKKRFLFAHSLGHLFLDHDIDQIEFKWDHTSMNMSLMGYFPSTVSEQEANAFAVELLIPEDQVRKYYNLFKNSDKIYILSKMFGVSKQAMVIRLRGLNLI